MDVEACAAGMADVEICGICPNDVGKVNGEGRLNVVAAVGGIDKVVGLYKK